MRNTRRGLLYGAAFAATALAGATVLSACKTTSGGGGPSLGTIQTYAQTAYNTLVSLAAIPALHNQLAPLLTEAKIALDAIQQLTVPGSGASQAQVLVSLVEQGLTIAAGIGGLSPGISAAIAAAGILVPVIAGFFGVTPTPAPGASLGRERLRAIVAGSKMTPDQANAYLADWNQHPS